MCQSPVERKDALLSTPIANSFPEHEHEGQLYPLDICQCTKCEHVQLGHVVTGLFDDYLYTSPPQLSGHLRANAEMLKKRYPKAQTVLEIGSNNGSYLLALKEHFPVVVGVDPAGTDWKEPFNVDVAKRVYKKHGPIDLVVSNNTLAHIDDLFEVFNGIDFLLADNGAVVFEVQNFQDMVDKGIFDTIYHEHLDYHRASDFAKFLPMFSLNLSAVEMIDQQGGSMRLTASRHHRTEWVDPKIDWWRFRGRRMLHVSKLKQLEGNIAVWGAPAKITTLIYQADLQNRINYVVDDAPQKQGRFVPGTAIPIVPEFQDKPDVVLLGAWNYEHVFKQKYPDLNGVNPYG